MARGDVHSAKCVQVPQPLDAGVRSRDSHWCCLWRSWDTSMRALRVFRMVSSILRQSFLQTGFETPEEICEYLERSQLHPTGRHWVDNLITPTLVAHQLIRSEREGDWLLKQFCIKRLLPYFFIAGHHNYARHLSWHCLDMLVLLPAEAKDGLLSGALVCRHKAGSWNAEYLFIVLMYLLKYFIKVYF